MTTPAMEGDLALRPARAEQTLTRIITLLPRGEAIRNFVYSGALDIMGAEAEVTVLSVIPSDELRELLASRYTLLPLQQIPERYPVRLLREVLDLAHGRRLWSKAAQERWYLRDEEAKSPRQRWKRRGKKLLCLPVHQHGGGGVSIPHGARRQPRDAQQRRFIRFICYGQK